MQLTSVRVVGADGRQVEFRLERSEVLGVVREAYSRRIGLNPSSFHLLFQDRRVEEDDTPASLSMGEEETLAVVSDCRKRRVEEEGSGQGYYKVIRKENFATG